MNVMSLPQRLLEAVQPGSGSRPSSSRNEDYIDVNQSALRTVYALKAAPAECQATIAERQAAAKAGRGGGPPLPPLPGPNEPMPCGFGRIAVGIAAGSGRTMAQIIPTLADLVGRPVIDKTGLTGLYDFSLKYAPELGRNAGPLGFAQPPGAPAPFVDADAPSLPAALQEQLGLKLEAARGPVEVVVIDKFEKPTLD